MEIRKHREITEKLLRQPYYFTQWQFCRRCKYVQYREQFRVVVEKVMVEEDTPLSTEIDYLDQRFRDATGG